MAKLAALSLVVMAGLLYMADAFPPFDFDDWGRFGAFPGMYGPWMPPMDPQALIPRMHELCNEWRANGFDDLNLDDDTHKEVSMMCDNALSSDPEATRRLYWFIMRRMPEALFTDNAH